MHPFIPDDMIVKSFKLLVDMGKMEYTRHRQNSRNFSCLPDFTTIERYNRQLSRNQGVQIDSLIFLMLMNKIRKNPGEGAISCIPHAGLLGGASEDEMIVANKIETDTNGKVFGWSEHAKGDAQALF